MQRPRNANEKITMMCNLIGIVCEELGLSAFQRTLAVSYLQTNRNACLKAYDRVAQMMGVN